MSPLDLLWTLEAIIAGCLIVCRFTDLPAQNPRWARLALILGSGAALGIGLSSCLFFTFGVLFHAPGVAMAIELALAAYLAFDAARRHVPIFAAGPPPARPAIVAVAAAILVLILVLATIGMSDGWDSNPHGGWDAWAIWNLRARFLASDSGLAQRAWGPTLGATTHAEYPLMLSGFIARCWAYDHSYSQAAPAAAGYALFLALTGLVTGGMALLRGPVIGLLAGSVVASTPTLLHQAAVQYADVPVACYFAGALIFALLDRPLIAGAFAALAAWTKDEGLLFLFAFLLASAVFRRGVVQAALGAAPIAAIVLFFKLVLATGKSSLLASSGQGVLQRLDFGHITQIAAAFAANFRDMAVGWYHPILPLIAVAVALRFDRKHRRDMAFCGAISACLLLGYVGVYLVTKENLAWLLQTSPNRLLVQLWPGLVLTAFAALRVPQATAIEAAPPRKARKKQKKVNA